MSEQEFLQLLWKTKWSVFTVVLGENFLWLVERALFHYSHKPTGRKWQNVMSSLQLTKRAICLTKTPFQLHNILMSLHVESTWNGVFHQIDSSLSLETADKTFPSYYMPSVQILQKPRKNKALVSAKCTYGIKFWGLRGLCFQDTPLVTKVKLESCAVLAIFEIAFHCSLQIFHFLAFGFQFSSKILGVFWIWHLMWFFGFSCSHIIIWALVSIQSERLLYVSTNLE